MTSIKNIVKVMNFHSLIRVDKAKKEASKYFEFEKDITKVLYTVVNNRNLKLDKKLMIENPNGITINIEMQYRKNKNLKDRIIYYSDRINVNDHYYKDNCNI